MIGKNVSNESSAISKIDYPCQAKKLGRFTYSSVLEMYIKYVHVCFFMAANLNQNALK